MKKPVKWIAVSGIGLVFISALAFTAYIYRNFRPSDKFSIGSCVEDRQVHRIYQITSIGATLDGPTDSAVILDAGVTIPGVYVAGQKTRIGPNDPNLAQVDCPN